MTDPLDFSGKLIEITGVGRAGQVGEAVALAFAQRGATLALLDVQAAEVEARAAWLTAQGFSATAHVADLANADAAKAAADQVIERTQAQFGGQVQERRFVELAFKQIEIAGEHLLRSRGERHAQQVVVALLLAWE